MAVALESFSVAGNGATSQATLTIGKPAGTTDGDLLVCILGTRDNDSDNVMTTLAGWTDIDGYLGDDSKGTSVGLGTYYKVAGVSEPTNYTWTQSRNMRFEGCIMRISGADTNSPIDASSLNWQQDFNTDITAPTCSPAEADSWLIAAVVMSSDGPFVTSPAGMTVVTEDAGATAIELGIAYEQLSASGPTGVRTWTKSSSGRNTGGQIAIKSSGGATQSLIVDMQNRKFNRITN